MHEDFKSLPVKSRNEEWMKRMEMRYAATNDRIKDVCRRYRQLFGINRSSETLNYHRWDAGGFILDEEHKLGYCENPKVGSSTWINLLYWLIPEKKRNEIEKVWETEKNGNMLNIAQCKRTFLWTEFKNKTSICLKMNAENKVEKLLSHINQNMFTFTFVRHPFERLISAYKNKGQNYEKMKQYGFGKWYLKDHSFPSFVDDVVLAQYRRSDCYKIYYKTCNENQYKFNYHWSPLSSRCSYCDMSYNVIGRMESFEEDVDYIFQKTDLEMLVPVEEQQNHLNPSGKGGENETLFYLEQLTDKQKLDVYNLYKMDFELFGYDASLLLPKSK